MSQGMFRAQDVTMRFKRKTVLDRLSIDVTPGEVTVVLGPNGIGKTTLFRVALGLLVPQSGNVTVQDLDPLESPKKLRQRTGFVPSAPDAYPWMSTRDLFRFLRPQYPDWVDDTADRLIDSLGVPADTPFKDLSRGEGMKAMLAAALAPAPELLLLDEPFAGLDPVAREDVLRGVISSLKEEGRTVVCATHDLEVASRIADRVAIMRDGRIASYEALDTLIPRAKNTDSVSSRLRNLLVGVT